MIHLLLNAIAFIVGAFTLRRLFDLFGGDCDVHTLRARIDPRTFRAKVVWITGASSGIGAALAIRLAKEGALLILTSRREDKLNKLADSLPCPRPNVHVLPMDLSGDLELIEQVAEDVPTIFGRLDFVFNNAGVSTRATAKDLEMEHVKDIMHLDFLAPATIGRACLPALRAAPSGGATIVNTVSIAAIIHTPLRSTYSAAKSALAAYFSCLALEEPLIRIINVFPGSIRTPVAINAITKGGKAFGRSDVNIENGLDVERAADRMLAAVSSGIENSWIAGRKELLATRIATFMPGLWAIIAKKRAAAYRKQIEKGVSLS